MTNEQGMTAKERDALREVVRLRARVAKADIEKRAALLKTEAEAQLSAKYRADDERWAHLVEMAKQVARDADAELLRIAKRDGIPLENRPSFHSAFFDRGDYMLPERRAELRRLAAAKIDLAVKDAKLSVERWQATQQTEILAGLLTSDEARATLAAMPTPEALLPAMTMKALDALVSGGNVLRLASSNGAPSNIDDD